MRPGSKHKQSLRGEVDRWNAKGGYMGTKGYGGKHDPQKVLRKLERMSEEKREERRLQNLDFKHALKRALMAGYK